MSKRRGNDEGAIYESPKGSGNWFAQLPADTSGKRPKRRAKSQKEAQRKLREMQQKREQGVDPGAKRMRLDAILDLWLEAEMKRTVKDQTLEGYERVLKLYVRPKLGDRWVDTLDRLAIQRWVNELSDVRKPNVTINAYRRLNAALEAAVGWGKLSRNPASGVKLPEPEASPGPRMEAAHVRTWLETTKDHRLGTLYLMAATLGLRIGELCGLCWRHYDRRNATITIDQQIHEVRSKLVTDEPKKGSVRILPVPALLAEALDRQWELLQRERTHASWREHGLIFPSENGKPLHPSNVNRHLRENLETLKLPHWSMHDFRRFAATHMTDLDVRENVIGAILGHTPGRNVTRRYAHVSLDAMRPAIQLVISDILKRAA